MGKMDNRRVVVVGAGIAGLSAALRLRNAGAEVTVFESSDRVGGRTSSETHDGFLYERGTQFFTSTYRNALGHIKEMGLEAELRTTSPWITVFKDGRPHRMPSGMLFGVYALTSGLLSVRDLVRFTRHTTSSRWPALDNYSAWAEYDDQDAASWSAPRLGRGAEYLLEPVLAGGAMQRIEETSRACALSLLAVTANGRSKDMTLARGNDSLPRAMAARVDVKLGAPVQTIEATPDAVTVRLPTETVRADAVVLATTASAAAGIYRAGDRIERELMATPYGSVIKVGLATKRDWSNHPGLSNVWAMTIPRGERRQIVSVTIESAKDPQRVIKVTAAAATFSRRYLIITQASAPSAMRRRTKKELARLRGLGPRASTTRCQPQKLAKEMAAPIRNAAPNRMPWKAARPTAPATAKSKISHRTRPKNRSLGSLSGIVLVQLANQFDHAGRDAQ